MVGGKGTRAQGPCDYFQAYPLTVLVMSPESVAKPCSPMAEFSVFAAELPTVRAELHSALPELLQGGRSLGRKGACRSQW